MPHPPSVVVSTGLPLRENKKNRVRDANRNERSRGRFLLHGQDMDKTQDHRSTS